MNSSCPICFDVFGNHKIVATPCGHVFHLNCILPCLNTSEDCPVCRSKITKNNLIKLFLNTTDNDILPLSSRLHADLNTAREKVKNLQDHAAYATQAYKIKHLKHMSLYTRYNKCKLHFENKIKNLVEENSILKSQANQFYHTHIALQITHHEIERILREHGVLLAQEVGDDIGENMANLCSSLKSELFKLKAEKEEYNKKIKKLSYQLNLKNRKKLMRPSK